MNNFVSPHAHHPECIAILRWLGLLTATPDAALDRLTRLAARLIDAPIALVSLLDENGELIKSQTGLPEAWAVQRQIPLSHAFARVALVNSEPLLIEDTRAHPLAHTNPFLADLNVLAYAGIPLVTEDGCRVGALSVAHTQPRHWCQTEEMRLRDLAALVMTEINLRVARQGRTERDAVTQVELARHAALASENARLLAAEQRARERTTRLQTITAALSNAVTPEQVAQVIVDEAVAAFGAVAGGAGVVNQDQATLHVLHSVGYPPPTVQTLENMPLDAGIPATEAARTGQLIVLETAEQRQQLFPLLRQVWEEQTWYRSVTALPLMAEGKVIGVLGLNFNEYRPFSAEDRAFLLALGEQCAQALERARLFRELEDAIKVRDDFMSIASHELKTPLTSLAIMTQSLRRHAAAGTLAALPAERLIRTLTMANSQVDKLTRLVTDLMDTGQIGAGRLELLLEESDLVNTVREVVDRFADEAGTVGSKIDLVASEPVIGRWDHARLDQVVTNLLSNAVKYGGGHPIEVSVLADGPFARLTVSDHGIGIPSERLAAIFERFERAVSARHFRGLGLGLYITQQIVEAHAGRIWVESQPNCGSTFTVELARQPEPS